MPQNVFTLGNDGDKIGIYANEALVNGAEGAQTVLIGAGAAKVTLAASMERADFTLGAAAVTFRANPDTLMFDVLRDGNVVASIANNAATGTVLAFTDGGVTVKLATNAAGETVFQIRAGSAAQEIPFDGDAVALTIAPDAALMSELAPAPAPTPPPAEDEVVTVAEARDGLAAGTLEPGAFTVMDTAAHLRDAPYAVIVNAGGVVLRDTVAALVRTDGAPTSAALAALDMAGSVVVADSLSHLVVSDLPDFGKPTTLLVTGSVDSGVYLEDATVAVAAAAQEELDAFLARDDVFYEGEKPARLTLAAYSLRDSVAHVAGADSALVAGARAVTLADSMAAVAGASLSLLGRVSGVDVEDTLDNIAAAKVSTSFLETLLTVDATFTATDDPGPAGSLSADAAALCAFGMVNGASILPGESVREINLFASAPVGTTTTSMNLDIFEGFAGTLNFTGTDGDDCVSIDAGSRITGGTLDVGGGNNVIRIEGGALDRVSAVGDANVKNSITLTGGTVKAVDGGPGKDDIGLSASRAGTSILVNGGGGADTITLGDANETVVLGDGVDPTVSVGAFTDMNRSTATIINNFTPFSGGSGDKLALAIREDFLSGLTLQVNTASGTGQLAINSINLDIANSSLGA